MLSVLSQGQRAGNSDTVADAGNWPVALDLGRSELPPSAGSSTAPLAEDVGCLVLLDPAPRDDLVAIRPEVWAPVRGRDRRIGLFASGASLTVELLP